MFIKLGLLSSEGSPFSILNEESIGIIESNLPSSSMELTYNGMLHSLNKQPD